MTHPQPAPTAGPKGGWLRPNNGVIEFVSTPSHSIAADILLGVSRFVEKNSTSFELNSWIEAIPEGDLSWSDSTTTLFLDLLRHGTSASWQFLVETNFFERALPDVAISLARQSADLSPDTHAHFAAVHALRSATAVANSHSDSLLLAAFLGELFDDPQETLPTLRSMQLEPEMTDEIIDLLSGARLLLASVERDDLALDDRFFNHIAHGLRRPGIVERSRLLADALGDPEPWQHAAMLEITTGVQVALAHPDLLDNPSESLENLLRRRADALATDLVLKERIAQAPTAYVLAHEPEDLVRLVRLIDPPPIGSTVRVVVEPGADKDTYKLNVVCRNRQGLLSRLTGVLADQGVSVVAASLATWPDESVLDSFVVTASTPPAPEALSVLFELSLAAQPAARRLVAPMPRITLDNSIHPLHSVIRVNGADQLGLLSVVSHAISAANIDVHHAVVRTVEGMVDDEFEVSHGDGRKISEADATSISGSIQLLTHP